MRTLLLRKSLIIIACSLLVHVSCPAAEGGARQQIAETPDWASVLPADTFLCLAIEDAGCFREAFFPSATSDEGVFSVEKLLAIIAESEPRAGEDLQNTVALGTGASLSGFLRRRTSRRFFSSEISSPKRETSPRFFPAKSVLWWRRSATKWSSKKREMSSASALRRLTCLS
jgi:hypothetical protein